MAAASEDKLEDSATSAEVARQKNIFILRLGIFQAVLQHVVMLQSEVKMFSNAVGGNQAIMARALATSSGLTGVAGLLINQIGGKLSDSIGRRPFLMIGPITNIACGMAIIKKADSVVALMILRIMKSVFTTFSGTVMCTAAFQDILRGEEKEANTTTVLATIGFAVVLAPFLESLIVKVGRGDPRSAYVGMIALSCWQLVSTLGLSETLDKAKRRGVSSLRDIVAGFNPFGFLTILTGNNQLLKKFFVIRTLQQCSDGKCTSDLCQQWCRNALQWTDNHLRNFIAVWGAMVIFGGGFVQPRLRKMLSGYSYSTVANLALWLSLSLNGLAEKALGTVAMWGGLPLLMPGINGGNATAVDRLSFEIGSKEGYGFGEMSAWGTNARTMMQSLDIILQGMWYARCKERGRSPGSTWMLAGFICGGLPQLLIWTMKPKDFKIPEDTAPAVA